MRSNVSINPAVLGANIAGARKRLGLTQATLAERIGVSRPTLIAFEAGQKPPAEPQIERLARELSVSVRDLLSLGAPDPALAVRFRALRGAEQAEHALQKLEDYGRRYLNLELLAKDRISRREPPPYSLDRVTNVERAAEELAATERLRLGLGDGPLPDLRAALEEDAGLRIFGLDELRKTKISGVFAYSETFGALVGFNIEHDPRRIRWTLCHEYAHFLVDRYEPEVTPDAFERSPRKDRREVLADSFASNFLMPATGLSRRFSEMLSDASGELRVSHLIMLAQFFDVSFQAMVQRLEELGRISTGTYELLKSRGFKPHEAENILGLDPRTPFERLPARYVFLVATLYDRGILSEGDVAVYLNVDRLQARELLQSLPEPDDADSGLDFPIEVLN